MQPWHSDGEHMNETVHLSPHCLNVFVPLCDVTKALGPTEFLPHSHYHYSTDVAAEAPCLREGQALLFDHRTKHRGLANKGTTARPLLYVTYAKAWFHELNNLGLMGKTAAYADLPDLVAVRNTANGPAARRDSKSGDT